MDGALCVASGCWLVAAVFVVVVVVVVVVGSRRRRCQCLTAILVVSVIMLAIPHIRVVGVLERRRVTRADVRARGLPRLLDGLRLVQLSDLHFDLPDPECAAQRSCSTAGYLNTAFLERIVATVNELRPDVVALTGDFVSWSRRGVDGLVPILSELRAPVVVGSLGNHDHLDQPAADHIIAALSRSGVRMLVNQRFEPIGGVMIAGLDDGREQYSVLAAANASQCCIVMLHNPGLADQLAQRCADIILSGHYHGGQFNLPTPLGQVSLLGMLHRFVLALPLWVQAAVPFSRRLKAISHIEWLAGLQRLTNGAVLYVSSGVGSKYGVRFSCDPEIALLTLRAA